MHEPVLFDASHRAVAAGEQPDTIPGEDEAVRVLIGLIVLTLLLIGLGIWPALVVFDHYREDWQLAQAGQTVDARITSGCRLDNRYQVTYAFHHPLPNGEPHTYTRTAFVDAARFEALEARREAAIRFLPTDPTVSRLVDEVPGRWFNVLQFGMLIYAVFALFGMPAIVVAGWRELQGERRLARGGQLLPGAIVAAHCTRDYDGTITLKVHYRFTPPVIGGTERSQQEVRMISKDNWTDLRSSELNPDTPVLVWYLDEHTYKVL